MSVSSKTATRGYPQSWLSTREFAERGNRKGLICYDEHGIPELLAFVWMDRDRRYFISNTSSLDEGRPYHRQRWRQVDPAPNAEPERVDLVVPQPKAAEIYYDTCGKIDQHNRHRQDVLQLERKLETKWWWMRVGLSILGIVLVDTWLAASQCMDGVEFAETQAEFYTWLAEEMIDNTLDTRARRGGGNDDDHDGSPRAPPLGLMRNNDGSPQSGIGVHLTPTKRKRKNQSDGQERNQILQGNCRDPDCKYKSSHACSACTAKSGKEYWLCHSKTGRECFHKHVLACHMAAAGDTNDDNDD